jgi:hypothetical protein
MLSLPYRCQTVSDSNLMCGRLEMVPKAFENIDEISLDLTIAFQNNIFKYN